jgi:hypothetical protein
VPFHELDALHHGPNWTEATSEELRAKVEPIVESDAWVIDGAYRGKLGDLVFERAEVVVWLDLPLRVWLPRLVWRTAHRVLRREELWNGNREQLRFVFDPRYSVIIFAVRNYRRRRRAYPAELARFPVARLRTTADVDAFLRRAALATAARRPTPQP